jgi:hypothetical protein
MIPGKIYRLVVLRKIVGIIIDIFYDNLITDSSIGDSLDNDFSIYIQNLFALHDQWLIGIINMTFIRHFVQDMKVAAFGSQG